MRDIPIATQRKLDKNNHSFYENANYVLHASVSYRNGEMFNVYTANEGTTLSASDVALLRYDTTKEPTRAYMAYIDNGIAHVQSKSLPYNKNTDWDYEFEIGTAEDVAIEFNGYWELSTKTGKWDLKTELSPWLFRVDGGVLTWWQWREEPEAENRIEGVSKVSALRGWRPANAQNYDDMGLIMAYIKSGKIYYRTYTVSTENRELSGWEEERQLDYDGNADTVTLFRTNDFRIGFCIGYQGTITNWYSQQMLSGMSTPVEIFPMPQIVEQKIDMYMMRQVPVMHKETFNAPKIVYQTISVGTPDDFESITPTVLSTERLDDYNFTVTFNAKVIVPFVGMMTGATNVVNIDDNTLKITVVEPLGAISEFTADKDSILATITNNIVEYLPQTTFKIGEIPPQTETFNAPFIDSQIIQLFEVSRLPNTQTETFNAPFIDSQIIKMYVVGFEPV